MTTYEYITIFTSIILGLAIVNVLKGISTIIHKSVKTRFYWIHSLWIVNIFAVILLLWWNNLILNDLPDLSFFHFVNLVAYAVILYLMSALLFPAKVEGDIDFKKLFLENRKTFYLLGMIFVLVDFTDAYIEKVVTQSELRIPQMINISIYFIMFGLGLRISSQAFQAAIALVFMTGLLIWLMLTIFVGFS